MKSLGEARLYGIVDLGYVSIADAVQAAVELVAGGVGVIQLRAKGVGREIVCDLAKKIAPVCRGGGIPFLLNDHVDLVLETGADGVHVGQDDMPVGRVREIIGPDRLVGLSTHSLDQVRQAVVCGPDYIGFGPLFATATKPDYSPIGTEDLRAAHELAPFPVFCIGGIKRENLAAVVSAGARRVVIVSGLLTAGDRAAYARDCLDLLPRVSAHVSQAAASRDAVEGSGITARIRS